MSARTLTLSIALCASALAAPALATPPSPSPSAIRVPAADDGPAPLVPLDVLLKRTSFVPPAPTLGAHDPARRTILPPAIAQPRAGTVIGGGFSVHGDIIVLEGDAETVSSYGEGRWGLALDETAQNPAVITERFLDYFPDDFDIVAVWTAFRDRGADGLAYYVGVRSDTRGIGYAPFDNGSYWGSNNAGRLQGFINMKSIEIYGDDIDNPNNYVYAVIGQEMTHRWLAKMSFKRANGEISEAMLGRDGTHWSSLLQADASVQDGNEWRDNGDGTFSLVDTNSRFSPLDLYAMGLYAPSEVPPFFLIENARFQQQQLSGVNVLPVGATISGDRTDITIEDVIAANGARLPNHEAAQKEFRIAYVLVTTPGQTADDVGHLVEKIQRFADNWTIRFGDWSKGRATLCARVSSNCEQPSLVLVEQSLRERAGDGDDMPEPGETWVVDLTVANRGQMTAEAPRVHLALDGVAGVAVERTPLTFQNIEGGASVEVPDAFVLTIGADATCGGTMTLPLEMATGDVLTSDAVSLPIGIDTLFMDDFEGAPTGWTLGAGDTAVAGAWEIGDPEGTTYGGFNRRRVQPETGANGTTNALVTTIAVGEDVGTNDVDGGTTSIVSPPISLAGAREPVLTYYSWHTALDTANRQGPPGNDTSDPLVVEVSPDDGQTWTVVDEDTSFTQQWELKSVRLGDVFATLPATLRVRVRMSDNDPQSLNEAGIDEVRVYDLQDTCFGTPWTPGGTVEPGEDVSGGDADAAGGDATGTSGAETDPVGGKSDDGCAGGGFAPSWLLALVGLALVTLRRRRVAIR